MIKSRSSDPYADVNTATSAYSMADAAIIELRKRANPPIDKLVPNYIDKLAIRIAERTNLDANAPDDLELLRMYAVLALTTGQVTSLENVHDTWSAWTSRVNPHHLSLVPFGDLDIKVQNLDAPYRDAIVELSIELKGES